MKWKNKKWNPQIGDLLTHEHLGVGYVVNVNHKNGHCVILWNKWSKSGEGYGYHYYNDINWETGPMKLYPVKL